WGRLVEASDEFDNPFHIMVVGDDERRETTSSLLERRYAWRGYSVEPMREAIQGRITLSACTADTTIATITANVDDGDGLAIAELYPEEVETLRDAGRKLCEFTRLAVDDAVRSQTVLGAIFHVACIYVIDLHRCSDVLIEVNPRHVRFYERMLGFERIGEERLDPRVAAPAVLLRLDLEHCASEITRLGGLRRSARERSFYPFFFDAGEAANIFRRLCGQ
ncbi:MAG TPA: N-acetyltransferase, partial [Caldimonas sp.]|nr:N-acetyltransferase [Caldimonas sp.]